MTAALDPSTDPAAELRRAVASTPLWYHTMDLGHGVVTPGWFDLRPLLDRLPIPDVRGKRCLDIGTWDGFFAFEMERRGAAEVIATDIPDHKDWDWPPRLRARGPQVLADMAGPEKGAGFRVAKAALGSRVDRRIISVYDLSPQTVGTFDVVICGSLMLHLRDPFRALEAVRSVCSGLLLSMEEIDLQLSLRARRRPLARIVGTEDVCVWTVPNMAGHRRMVESAGFEVISSFGPYADPLGPAHPRPGRSLRVGVQRAVRRVVAGNEGVPHGAVLARPL